MSVDDANSELVDEVDIDDRVLRVVPRSVMRRDRLRHRAVFVAVTDGEGRLLVHRRSDGKDVWPGWFDIAVGGVVASGESYESAATREVAEEVGVTVTDLRYFGSQSWPFPHSLMVAYTARWTGGDIVPQEGEIADARWFPLDALPTIPQPLSIAGHLIRDTVARMRASGQPG